MLTGDATPYDFDRPAHVVFVAQHPNQMVPREEVPEGAGEIDLYDDKVQAGIAWTMRQWSETLGLTTWTQGDGSESVEGDVGAEIHTILCNAGLRDPETNRMATLRAQQPADDAADLFKALRDESWDLRCFNLPTGGDDFDIGWRVVGHWQAEPCERTIAEVFSDDPAEAVRQALAALKAEGAG